MCTTTEAPQPEAEVSHGEMEADDGKPVVIAGHKNLFVASVVQACNVAFNVCLVLGEALVVGAEVQAWHRGKLLRLLKGLI